MKVIGLIGGMSWESTAEYYRIINQEVRARTGPLRSAEILLHSVDFGHVAQAQHDGRWDLAGDTMARSARRLEAAGADLLLLCTNTMHKVADAVQGATELPLLHIATPVGEAATRAGWRRVGLLATAFTMEQAFLRDRLAQAHGLQVLTPEPPDRAEVHRVIYEELCRGKVLDRSRAQFSREIRRFADRGAQAVILGCTEIMLLVRPQDSCLPLLDSTRLHALAAVDAALRTTQADEDVVCPCPPGSEGHCSASGERLFD